MGLDQGSDVSERIRQVIREHGHLPVDIASLDDDADLFQAGMTSHASVNLMLGLEAAFDVEFPDRDAQAKRLPERLRDRGGARRAASAAAA